MARKRIITTKSCLRSGLAAFALLSMTQVSGVEDEISQKSLADLAARMIDHQSNTTPKTNRLKPTTNKDLYFNPVIVGKLSGNVQAGTEILLSMAAEVNRYTQNGFVFQPITAPYKVVRAIITSPVQTEPEKRKITQEEFDARFGMSAQEAVEKQAPDTQATSLDQMPVGNVCGVNAVADQYFDAVIGKSDSKATRLTEIIEEGRREFYRMSSRTVEITKDSGIWALSEMQSALKTVGCYTGEITGVFDAATTRAVRAFQSVMKGRYTDIHVTGRADPTTLRTLGYEAMRILFYNGRRDFLSRFLRIDLDNTQTVASVTGGCGPIEGLADFRNQNTAIDINALAADVGVQHNYVSMNLEKGHRDTSGYGPVRLAQFQLATLQCTGSATIKHGAIDGVFGGGTEKWVKHFQTQYGERYNLDVNGKLDEQTRAALSYESSLVMAFINSEIDKRARQYNVDPEKLTRLFMHESLGIPIMASGTGPAGLGQPTQSLSRSLAETLGYERPKNQEEVVAFQTSIPKNVHISAYYFGQLLDTAETKAPNMSESTQFQMAYTSYRDGPTAGLRAINALLNGNVNASLKGASVNGTANMPVGKIEEHFNRKMNEPHKIGQGSIFKALRNELVGARNVFSFVANTSYIPDSAASKYRSLPNPLFSQYSGPMRGLW